MVETEQGNGTRRMRESEGQVKVSQTKVFERSRRAGKEVHPGWKRNRWKTEEDDGRTKSSWA